MLGMVMASPEPAAGTGTKGKSQQTGAVLLGDGTAAELSELPVGEAGFGELLRQVAGELEGDPGTLQGNAGEQTSAEKAAPADTVVDPALMQLLQAEPGQQSLSAALPENSQGELGIADQEALAAEPELAVPQSEDDLLAPIPDEVDIDPAATVSLQQAHALPKAARPGSSAESAQTLATGAGEAGVNQLAPSVKGAALPGTDADILPNPARAEGEADMIPVSAQQASLNAATGKGALKLEGLTGERLNLSQASADTPVITGQEEQRAQDFARLLETSRNQVTETRTPAATRLPTLTAAEPEQMTQGLRERVSMMVGQRLQQAEIRLDPPELGTLMIRLQLNQDQAQLSIVTQHAATRDLVEQSLGGLRQLLSDQGLQLTDAQVNQQASQQQQGRKGQPGSAAAGEQLLTDAEPEAAEVAEAAKSVTVGVDYYA